jgi:hypothetical protein
MRPLGPISILCLLSGAVACADDDSKADRDDTTGEVMMTTTPPATTATTGTTGTTGTSTGTDTVATMGPSDSTATSDADTSAATAVDTGCVADCGDMVCGVDACGASCGTCGPSATCADDQSWCALPIGFSVDLGSVGPVGPDVQVGHRITLFQPRVVRQLGVIAGAAGDDVRMALYTHDGTGPATQLVETSVATLARGANAIDVAPTSVDAGDYWIMIHVQSATQLAQTDAADAGYETATVDPAPFMDGFAASLVSETVDTDVRRNLYLVVED